MLSAEQITNALGTNPENTKANWPPIVAALQEVGADSLNSLLAVAATIYVEVGPNFMPIAEKRVVLGPKSSDEQRKIKGYQDKYWASGYYGRGYPQHTHKSNYQWLQDVTGLPFMAKPDLLLEPGPAAKAFAVWWKHQRAYTMAHQRNWDGVRRIVNGAHMVHLDKFKQAIEKLEIELAR